jgi:hypothetical protein
MYTGPNIITNGLVLSLDAANIKSYFGSGNVWRDLSGNNIVGTTITGSLINSLTYTTSYNGGLVQNGTNSYINIPYIPSLAFPGNTSFSFQLTLQNKSFINTDFPAILSFGEQDATGFIGGWMVFYYYNSLYTGPYGVFSVARFASINTAIGTGINYNFISTAESQQPTVWTYTYDSVSGARGYMNGALFQSDPTVGAAGTPAGGPFAIGRRAGNTSRVTNAIINSLQIYNRSLSASEVLQNYNATKGRFGL